MVATECTDNTDFVLPRMRNLHEEEATDYTDTTDNSTKFRSNKFLHIALHLQKAIRVIRAIRGKTKF